MSKKSTSVNHKKLTITLTGDLVKAWEVVRTSAVFKDDSDCFRDILRTYIETKSLKVIFNVADN